MFLPRKTKGDVSDPNPSLSLPLSPPHTKGRHPGERDGEWNGILCGIFSGCPSSRRIRVSIAEWGPYAKRRNLGRSPAAAGDRPWTVRRPCGGGVFEGSALGSVASRRFASFRSCARRSIPKIVLLARCQERSRFVRASWNIFTTDLEIAYELALSLSLLYGFDRPLRTASKVQVVQHGTGLGW